MIRKGQIIKHNQAMNVCFLVEKVRGPYAPNQRVEIFGEWINMGYVQSWHLYGTRTKIRTTRPMLSQWSVCLEPTVVCLRHAKWEVAGA